MQSDNPNQAAGRTPVRICVLGAESTGKTTLCQGLARHYGVPFVPEFGRWYTEAMPDPTRYEWRHEDFVAIAEAQNRFEDDAVRWIWPVLICDTNSFVTAVFEEAYLGDAARGLEDTWRDRTYDLLVLTDPDTPFIQDETTGLRSPDARGWMHARYEQYAREATARWILAEGSAETRIAACVSAIDGLRA